MQHETQALPLSSSLQSVLGRAFLHCARQKKNRTWGESGEGGVDSETVMRSIISRLFPTDGFLEFPGCSVPFLYISPTKVLDTDLYKACTSLRITSQELKKCPYHLVANPLQLGSLSCLVFIRLPECNRAGSLLAWGLGCCVWIFILDYPGHHFIIQLYNRI